MVEPRLAPNCCVAGQEEGGEGDEGGAKLALRKYPACFCSMQDCCGVQCALCSVQREAYSVQEEVVVVGGGSKGGRVQPLPATTARPSCRVACLEQPHRYGEHHDGGAERPLASGDGPGVPL